MPTTFLLLSFATLALSAGTSSNTLCKGGLPAIAASALSGYQSASAFCTTSFPVPTTTTTFTAPTTTITVSLSTVTLTTTASTTFTTTTDSIITSIETDLATTTVTSTTTTTGAIRYQRRSFKPSHRLQNRDQALPVIILRPLSSPSGSLVGRSSDQLSGVAISIADRLFSSIRAKESAFVGSVCTCLEVQPTKSVTVTPSVTVTVTPLTTASVTQTKIIHTTAVTTTSTTSTETNTVIATATVNPAPPCTGSSGDQCSSGNKFYTACDTLISASGGNSGSSVTTTSSGAACRQACFNDADCNLFQFIPRSSTSGTCNLFDNAAGDAIYASVPGDYSGFNYAIC